MASTITGMYRLKKKLQALTPTIKAEVRIAIAAEANKINAMQKRQLANRVTQRTGDLMESIQWNWGNQNPPAYASLRKGGSSGSDPELTAIMTAGNARVRRAHLIEFGTAPHIVGGIFAGAQHPGTNPMPYFYPPFRAGKKKAKSAIGRAITKACKKVASG